MAEVTNEELLAFLKENFNKVYQETFRIKKVQQDEIMDKLNPTFGNVRILYSEIESLKEEVQSLRREIKALRR